MITFSARRQLLALLERTIKELDNDPRYKQELEIIKEHAQEIREQWVKLK